MKPLFAYLGKSKIVFKPFQRCLSINCAPNVHLSIFGATPYESVGGRRIGHAKPYFGHYTAVHIVQRMTRMDQTHMTRLPDTLR